MAMNERVLIFVALSLGMQRALLGSMLRRSIPGTCASSQDEYLFSFKSYIYDSRSIFLRARDRRFTSFLENGYIGPAAA